MALIRSRQRGLAATLQFLAAFLVAALRDRPLRLRPFRPGMPSGILTPHGDFMPAISGADDGSVEEFEDQVEEANPEVEDKTDDPAKQEDDPDTRIEPDDDFKTKSRKNENWAKKEKRKREEVEEELRERKQQDETEAQKKVREAEEKGRKEAETDAQKEARATRLESAVTKVAVKKLKIGSGDDAEEHQFADPDDAQILIERAIAKGDLDEDELFSEKGQVDAEVLERELAGFLQRKTHLRAEQTKGNGSGDGDLRKGDPASGDLEDMSIDDHVKRKYGSGDRK